MNVALSGGLLLQLCVSDGAADCLAQSSVRLFSSDSLHLKRPAC